MSPESTTPRTEKPASAESGGRWKRYEGWIWTIVVVFLLRAFVVQAYEIPTGSMEDTLLPGDFLLATKFVYGVEIPYTSIKLMDFKKPSVGNVVVFPSPIKGQSTDFVKRVVALEGDTVEVRNKTLYVNGTKRDEAYVVHKDPRVIPFSMSIYSSLSPEAFQRKWERGDFTDTRELRDNFGPVVVPEGHVFVMGDNRDYSLDSRFWGPLSTKRLKGSPLIVYMSWNGGGAFWKLWERIRWARLLKILVWT